MKDILCKKWSATKDEQDIIIVSGWSLLKLGTGDDSNIERFQ